MKVPAQCRPFSSIHTESVTSMSCDMPVRALGDESSHPFAVTGKDQGMSLPVKFNALLIAHTLSLLPTLVDAPF